MRQISKVAGVSVTTVSNVLRKRGRVSEDTREQVLAVAKELGYFQTRARGQLGVIYYAPSQGEGSYYTTEAISGIGEIVEAAGYQLVFQILDDLSSQEPPMVDSGIEGILLIGGTISDQLVEKLAQRKIPLVLLFTEHPTLDLNCVLIDNQKGASRAVQHLLSLGHKRIGFINGWSHTHTSAAKLAGYRHALAEAGLPFEPSLYTEGDFTIEGGAQRLNQLLEQAPDLTALFAGDDLMALGAMRQAKAIGRELAVVGFGDSPLAELADPPLTTVGAQKRLIGKLAAQRLLALLVEDEKPLKILTPTKLIIRNSTGC